MALTFEVNKDKTVTIYNDGTIFSHQTDDPDVEGYDVFETKARAEEWAKTAIAKYEAEMAAEKVAAEAAAKAAAEALELSTKLVAEGQEAIEGSVAEEAKASKASSK